MRKKVYLIPISALVSVLICIGTITLAGAGSGVTKTNTLLEQANELRHAQKYSEAEKLYNQVKAENPGSDKALEAQKQLIHLAIDCQWALQIRALSSHLELFSTSCLQAHFLFEVQMQLLLF